MAMTERVDGLPDLPTPDEINDGVLHVFDELDAPEGEARTMYERGDGRFTLGDDGQADWAARKLAAVRARIESTNETAKRQVDAIMEMVEPHVAPIRAWHDETVSPLLDEETYWEGLLTLYHRDVVLVADKDAKTVKLPHGTLKARKSPDKWNVAEETTLDWARAHAHELIRTKEEIDKALLKKVLKPNSLGQAILDLPEGQLAAAGVEVTPGEVKFTVETEVAQ